MKHSDINKTTTTNHTTSLILPAPAKLNLFLHITGQRKDGYHTLQTLFQLLDRGDYLEFQCRTDAQLTLQPELPGLEPEDNLILRAARLLQSVAPPQTADSSKPGADIQLTKNLPMGGGIGGGSSNAATTLLGLNQLWQLNLPLTELAELGRQLGADVPVFVHGQTAWAEGIGEQLQALEMPEKWFLILTPNCHVSTADIFSRNKLTRDTPNITVAAFLEQGGHNDCQPLVRQLYPEVDKALIWLSLFGDARMTGTGACVFAPFDSEAAANAVLEKTPDSLSGFVAQGVNQSPVHKRLNR